MARKHVPHASAPVPGKGRRQEKQADITCAPQVGSEKGLAMLTIMVLASALYTDLFLLTSVEVTHPETQGLSVTLAIILDTII